ncbi:hypothetical protein NDU88_002807 [Pleurodeles waltl]|uniref:Uncharacterized protein n=1 Tax=Pleurodeles waltl TaxID=8319 RepID=A0AAV7MPV4_PLEWA|nr:hypothetical protein NDU88_002807 [Pleurodeles waltl]
MKAITTKPNPEEESTRNTKINKETNKQITKVLHSACKRSFHDTPKIHFASFELSMHLCTAQKKLFCPFFKQ